MKKAKYETLLGFDYGEKYIGVAVGQTVTKTAKALTSLKVSRELMWGEIAELIRMWKPSLLVVGNPLNMDGTVQPIAEKAAQFAEELKKRFGLAVELIDERLTTVAAREQLFAKSGYRALKKTAIDATSALIILESWMKSHL